jgi:hypothetical protein
MRAYHHQYDVNVVKAARVERLKAATSGKPNTSCGQDSRAGV